MKWIDIWRHGLKSGFAAFFVDMVNNGILNQAGGIVASRLCGFDKPSARAKMSIQEAVSDILSCGGVEVDNGFDMEACEREGVSDFIPMEHMDFDARNATILGIAIAVIVMARELPEGVESHPSQALPVVVLDKPVVGVDEQFTAWFEGAANGIQAELPVVFSGYHTESAEEADGGIQRAIGNKTEAGQIALDAEAIAID